MTMTPDQKAVWDRHNAGLGFTAIARELGISRRSARERYQRAKAHQDVDPAIQAAMDAFGLTTEPDLIWFKNKNLSVKVRNPAGDDPQQFLDRALEAFKDIPAAILVPPPVEILPESLVIYPLFDVHLGMRAHAQISGEEVNLQLGIERVQQGMLRAMRGAPAAQRAVIINGGDFTHQTDDLNRTRRSGHILDVDGRNVMTVLAAIELISFCIEQALTKHQEVEYCSVPGNHDQQNWETILIGLRERYRDNPRVRIDFQLTEFTIIQHGEVVVFVHHGDKRPPKDLAMFCAAEFSQIWGQATYRILMTGHRHHYAVQEFPGIYWVQMPAISARDQHAAGGFYSKSLFMALGFDHKGETSRTTVQL